MPKMGIVFYKLESSCAKIENQMVMFYAYQLSGPPLDERAGKNHFDEVDEEILPNLDDFVVKKVSCSQMGDLKITFENQFILEVFIDSSTYQECWRFFRPYEDEEHVVIAGTGMIDEDDICM